MGYNSEKRGLSRGRRKPRLTMLPRRHKTDQTYDEIKRMQVACLQPAACILLLTGSKAARDTFSAKYIALFTMFKCLMFEKLLRIQ